MFELPLSLSARVRWRIRRTLMGYTGHGMSAARVRSGLERLYDTPDSGRHFDIVTACECLYAFPDIPRTLRLMSLLGDACLVTYFHGAAHAVERPLRAMPLEGRESFVYEDVTWTAVWWRPHSR